MELFAADPAVRERGTPVVLAEMTLRSLTTAHARHEDFLARADMLRVLGFDVLISRFEQFYYLRSVKAYVYPTRDPTTGDIDSWETVQLPPPWQHLHMLLGELGRIVPIRSFEESYLSIDTADVLARIQRDDPSFEAMVPPKVAAIIKTNRLFRT
jgi:hypothetical protein